MRLGEDKIQRLVEALNRYEKQKEERKAVSLENNSEKTLSRQSSETKLNTKLVLLFLKFTNLINKMFMKSVYLKN